jgi:hypothetical protein
VPLRLATWNVNSVKQRLPRLLPWLDERHPDVVRKGPSDHAPVVVALDEAPTATPGAVVPPPSRLLTKRGAAKLPQSR